MQTGNVIFAIDQPSTRWFARVRSPFIVNGWVIPDPENPLKEIEVRVNGELRALAITRLRRQDVADAYPERESLWSGFVAEVFVDDLDNSKVRVEVNAVFEEGEMSVDRFELKGKGLTRPARAQTRKWSHQR